MEINLHREQVCSRCVFIFYFSIFHKADGGQWGKANDISNVSYDGEYLSFVVSSFSSYGYAAVPEPSTYAAIFGVIALGFVAYRRRK